MKINRISPIRKTVFCLRQKRPYLIDVRTGETIAYATVKEAWEAKRVLDITV